MNQNGLLSPQSLGRDFVAGIVVFLVALPLCLGIALASGAPLISGLIAGIVGGLVVGTLSGSHTSVSGPAAGLTAIVASQIAMLGSFDAFLMAVVIAGVIQIVLGLARGGFIAAFVPSSVIKGLLTAIGLLLIIKQTPYVLGLVKHGATETGVEHLTPQTPDIFTELMTLFEGELSIPALCIGVGSIALLVGWDKVPALKKSLIPAPLIVVVIGVLVKLGLRELGEPYRLGQARLVEVPIAATYGDLLTFITLPDFSRALEPAVITAGFMIAIVASLETLLNLEAVDNLDPKRRPSPPSRELFAQGVGNLSCGLIGGLPVTSVIVRGTVNINAGAQSKMSAVLHGGFLAAALVFLPNILNLIPLSSLAAILMVTGFKLATPKLFRQLWSEGRYQFLPFIITVLAIIATDLLRGIVIGLVVALAFILMSNYKRPMHLVIEKHLAGDLYRLQLANQVSFLNRAALDKALNNIPRGASALIDATGTDYLDPDILSLIKDYKDKTAPARGVDVNLLGFRDAYRMYDDIHFVDYSTRELQASITPTQVFALLCEGNKRFRTRKSLSRDLVRQVDATAKGQYPMAMVVSCMDSRTPARLIFDLSIGDVLNIRVPAGVFLDSKVIAGIEFGTLEAGAKLVVMMAHTGSTVMRAIVENVCDAGDGGAAEHGEYFERLVEDVADRITPDERREYASLSPEMQSRFCDEVFRRHVIHAVEEIRRRDRTIDRLLRQQQIGMIAAVYDIRSGNVEFLVDTAIGFHPVAPQQETDSEPRAEPAIAASGENS